MKHVLVAVLAVAILAALAVYAIGADKPAPPAAAAATAGQKLLPAESPVVAAFPYKEDTEYEQDPFDTTKLKRTNMTVTHIVIVRADGSTTIKPVP